MAKKGDVFHTAFDSYTVEKQRGEGGAGVVYSVKSEGGQHLALKVLRAVETVRRKRFLNELGFCYRNQDPRIIRVLDWGYIWKDKKKVPFYLMPHYDASLRSLMEAGLSPDEALRRVCQILEGVGNAHKGGVYHRDLKPENILVGEDENLVIADFGTAHFTEDLLITTVKTAAEDRLANFRYAAPEQKEKGARVDHRADIYSLGLIIHEMFTGVLADGRGVIPIAAKHPKFEHVDEAVDQMLQNDPGDRPSSVGEVRLRLCGEPDAHRREVPGAADPTPVAPRTEQIRMAAEQVTYDEEWVERNHVQALTGLERLNMRGYWSALAGHAGGAQHALPALVEATRAAAIRGTGWPIGIYLDQVEDRQPKPFPDGLRTEVASEPDLYDFWALHTRGSFNVVRNLAQFEKRDDVLWLQQPVWNAAHLLLYLRRLYAGLGVPGATPIDLRMKYTGLAGRSLGSGDGRRHILPGRRAAADDVPLRIAFDLSQVDQDLPALVHDLASPVLLMFDFFELEPRVCADIVGEYRQSVGA